jgi:pimeloyl-ACP methyl ester carboxylesterase
MNDDATQMRPTHRPEQRWNIRKDWQDRATAAQIGRTKPHARNAMDSGLSAAVQADEPVLHLRRAGGGRHSCLMIHGFGEGGYVWDRVLPAIASRYDAIAPDLRGHGDSAWDAEARYDVQAHIDDVVHVIRALDLRRLVLVGHSMGGEIAVHVAAQCADRVAGLVIVDFGPCLNPEGIAMVRAEIEAANRVYSSVEEYASWLSKRRPLIAKEVLLSLAQCALRAHPGEGFRLKVDPAITRSQCRQSNAASDAGLWSLLSRMAWPVLVVRGAGSAVLSRNVAERMIEIMPYARLETVPAAGHGVILDNPKGFEAAIRPFLMPDGCL